MKSSIKNKIYLVLMILFTSFCVKETSAQPVLPQRAITVYPAQAINFGLFYDINGAGGTISVDPQGNRTVTGSINKLPSYPGRPALFEIKLCQGRTITLSYPPNTVLKDTHGNEITMEIGPTEKGGNGATFAIENNCNFITILRVGGTLIIPPNTRTGVFSGEFNISFDQQ